MTSLRPVILAGMHRSGTSMAASLLHACGINMGDRLMGADHGNTKGHFENLDFVDFHSAILQHHGLTPAGWVHDRDLPVPETLLDRARQIIADNAAHAGPRGWGWKDPRTTLFLDYWQALLPGARFVFIYRMPWEVADSIFRRGTENDQFFQEDPADTVRVWSHYNQQLLAFMERHPGQCVLVANDAVVADPAAFTALLNDRFGLQLEPPAAGIVDKSLMHTEASASTHVQLVLQTFPGVRDLLKVLHERASLKAAPPPGELPNSLADSYRDWFRANHLQRQFKLRTTELEGHVAWHQEKVRLLEASLEKAQELAAENARQAAREAAQEVGRDFAQRLDVEHWEWLKERAGRAEAAAELQLLRALVGGNADPALASSGVPVVYDPPDAAKVDRTKVLAVVAYLFHPGDYDVKVRFAEEASWPVTLECRGPDWRDSVACEARMGGVLRISQKVPTLRVRVPHEVVATVVGVEISPVPGKVVSLDSQSSNKTGESS